VTKTRSELWRKDREIMVSQILSGSSLVEALGHRLQGLRCFMHETLDLPEPPRYATCSVDNIRRLCEDIENLAVALMLRAKGLTNESDEILAEGLIQEIEEETFGLAPDPRGH
jgi:hypothetical protein